MAPLWGATAQAVSIGPEFVDLSPPLWDGLGTLSFRISTTNVEAQAYFDQGLRLAYSFNHDEARRAFREAQRHDPDCAMCFWGEALVLGPNINLSFQQTAIEPAYTAVQKALSLAASTAKNPITPRERALIAALAVRYASDSAVSRAMLDAAYSAAMQQVANEFPDDIDIAVLYAESVMDLSPWNYWKPGGTEPNPQSAPLVPTLERVLERAPNHPGALHYYIHAVEGSDRPMRAMSAADRLRGAMPGAGHMLHMPAHIYYRFGRYLDALAVSKDAVAADEKYFLESRAPLGSYRLKYYPHHLHFLLASAEMSGDAEIALATARKLELLNIGDQPDKAAGEIPLKALIYFAYAQFSAPDAVLALPDPGTASSFQAAMWRYARGVALARRGDLVSADLEATAIGALTESATAPALNLLKLAQTVVFARIAQAKGDYSTAIARFEEAASIEEGLPTSEPPQWPYPVRQSLGGVLLQAGRLDEALDQFQRALKRAPNNGWTYYGLAQLYRARGDVEAARSAEAQLAINWSGNPALLDVSKL
jgi:tetratricopeptide (TPR) repeat protein